MEKKVLIIIALTLPMLVSWWPFQYISEKPIDLFIFIEFAQKPKWYAVYTAQYLNIIALSYVIHIMCKEFMPKLKHLTAMFLIFAILRLAMYWGFRGQIPLLPIIGSMLLYILVTFKNYGKGSVNN